MGEIDAGFDGVDRFGAFHRRAFRDIPGPKSDLAPAQPGCAGERVVHPNIDHAQLGADVAGEHVHRCTPGQHVADHLRRYRLGVRRYPFLGDTVIRGEGEYLLRSEHGPGGAGYQAVAPRHVLDDSETSGRLGQPVEP